MPSIDSPLQNCGNKYEQRTFQERLRRASRFWAGVWTACEFFRLVAACVSFIGPTYILVTWLFDFLQQTFDPDRNPELLKEWSYYVLLIAIFPVTQFPIWWLAARVQTSIRRQFEVPSASGEIIE